MEKNTRRGGKVIVEKKTKSRVRLSRFVFTLNNWTPEEYEDIITFPCKWMIVAKEEGEQGTPHLQGACVLGKQLYLSYLKNGPFKRAHIEDMRGSPQQSIDYCTKQDPIPFQKGTLPSPGQRTDLENACAEIRSGKTIADLAQLSNSAPVIVKYYKGLMQYRSLVATGVGDRIPPRVFWLYGETGTGKTRSAVEFATRQGRYWMSNGSLRWFDGYQGERTVILDDIRSDACSFDFLLRLLDRYPFRVEYKGGFVDWCPQFILLTCWARPDQLFTLRGQGDVDQLIRRIEKIVEFNGDHHDLFKLIGGNMELGRRNSSFDDEGTDEGTGGSSSSADSEHAPAPQP